MRYAGFFVLLFLVDENLSFFVTANDIDDGNLSIFEGGVENNGDKFLIIDGVPDNVDVVVSAVDIDDGLEASIFDISRFGDMFEFVDAIVVLCNLPSAVSRLTMGLAGSISQLKWRNSLKASRWSKRR
jgi:hypothetical protein